MEKETLTSPDKQENSTSHKLPLTPEIMMGTDKGVDQIAKWLDTLFPSAAEMFKQRESGDFEPFDCPSDLSSTVRD